MSDIVFANNFRVENLSISAVKTLDSGAKQAYVNYGGKKLLMQTPIKVTLPYGLNVYDKVPGATPEYSISISMRGYDTAGNDMKKFHDALHAFDEFMIEEAYKNRKTWFKGVDSKEVIRAFYTPTIKVALDKQGNPAPYPPTMKAKIRKTGGQVETKFYNEKGVLYDKSMEELLQKNVDITAILQCGGLWFAGGKFGVTWRAIQVVVHKLVEKLPDFAFQGIGGSSAAADDEEGEEDDAAPQQINDNDVLGAVLPRATPVAAAPVVAAPANEPEDNEELPVPKPTTVVKKRIVKPAAK